MMSILLDVKMSVLWFPTQTLIEEHLHGQLPERDGAGDRGSAGGC